MGKYQTNKRAYLLSALRSCAAMCVQSGTNIANRCEEQVWSALVHMGHSGEGKMNSII